MDRLIFIVIFIFFLCGGLDYLIDNRFGIGKKFEDGIKTMGPLGLSMIGLFSLAPVLSEILSKIAVPAAKLLKLDPSIFAASIFAIDMGGYQLAKELALTKEMGLFSGIILASNLGTVISFTIPVAKGIINKEDEKYYLKGSIAGIISIPLGCLTAGFIQNMNINILITNIIPVVLFSMLFSLGLLFSPNTLLKIFNVFGKILIALSILGLLLQGTDSILKYKVISNLTPLPEVMTIVGKIAFVLGGAYPLLEVVNKLFKTYFDRLGNKMGINAASVGGLIGNLASNLLVFSTFKEMNPKGKVLCTAFAMSGAFVFGGQLGFVSGFEPGMIKAFIISKFVGGLFSIALASWMFEQDERKNNFKGVISYDYQGES